MRSRSCSLAGLLIMSVAATAASAQVRVYAQVDTDGDIYVGDNFAYYVVLAGSEEAGEVDLEPLRPYNPRSTGNRKQTSTNIVGSQVTTATTMIMTYALTVNQAGRVQIPSVSVELDGKTYRTNPVTVNVIKPGTTDRLDVEMTLSEQQCFTGQPILLTINFYYATEIKNTQFNVPVLGSDAFYFENPDVGNQQAQEYDLGTGVTVMVSQLEAMHNGRRSNLLVMRKILIPKTAGRIQIEPTSVSADVPVGQVRSGRGFDSFFGPQIRYRRFIVQSEPINLTVSSLPEEGKPDQFYGLVGQYTIEASASPTRVNVGDPITLTIKVGGGAYLKPVRWPQLEQIPQLAANFKIPSEQASPTIADGFKVFTQTIRANNDKVTEIPSIPLAYFDADKGEYVTARSEPIELEVAPTKILTNADFEGADFTGVNREVEAIKKGLSANYDSLDALEDKSFSPLAAVANPAYTAIWAVPLLAFISSVLARVFTRSSPERVAQKRRRQACARATGQLKKLTLADRDRQAELLVSIMKQYIGERFDKTAGSLTPDDCHDAIFAATEDEQTAEKYRNTIADFEAGRYAPMAVVITPERTMEVIQLVRTVEKNCRK